MRHSLISRPRTVLQPAWWCRITVHPSHPFDTRETAASHLAPDPAAALRWLRTQLRVVLHLMCPEDSRAAFRWLDHGQAAALLSLRAGDPAHFTGQSDTVQIQLTARPVLPLPRAPLTAPCEHRAPTP